MSVLFDDLLFDGIDGRCPLLAVVALVVARGADEVWVAVPGAGFCHQDDESASARAAVNGSFEVVGVFSGSFTIAVGGHNALYLMPGRFVHKCFVLAGVPHSVETDDAHVVCAAEKPVQTGFNDGLRWNVGGRPRCQAHSGQVGGEGFYRPVSSCIEFEGSFHEWPTYRVDFDGALFFSFSSANCDVVIAQWSPTGCPAALHFLVEAFDDFVGEVAGVELSNGGHDAVKEHAGRGLVDAFGCGDQRCSSIEERLADLDVVGPVAGKPVNFVDDHVVDLVFADIFQHFLEFRPIGRAG